MKIELKYVNPEPRGGRTYYYFRRSGVRIALPGVPGTREFQEAYDDAISQHAPELRKKIRGNGARGTVDWAIIQFKSSEQWKELSDSTKDVYNRRFDWLRENYGGELLAAFDRRIIKRIRNLPEFKDRTSVADAIVDRLGALWNFVDEFTDLELPGINPTTGVRPRHEAGDPHPAWPEELCRAFEAYPHPRMVTAYFLLRYTGQRRGDCSMMKRSDFNHATREMFVVQEKTGAKIWVPAPQRLLDHLASLPQEPGDYILMSPKGDRYASTSLTNLICGITADLDFTTTDSKGKKRGYSPHGLRHLCGAELAEAGCTIDQVMSILGHATEKQARRYVEQANKRRMAHEGNRRREEMYARQATEKAINAAPNVRKIKDAS
ncbi:tyrosine-type recombinase/integrase [Bradyrhizobium ottawaense]|uniref:tyrosine-type recombinase/integrase n=1 Tax=Bradyrhizobium ottawaense TaxID=931866 RepID=UPI0027D65251|nr:tyrosine-type recombinase/integrase [Bradyrhizobium ottawaense]GMP00199.1 tyrosine-type recombinase/integrase [Bradyrhizobium ottawaense]GMP11684.1 tyrosine-type recombinase/integrase [Bradyrhizobium ottawaense]GMP15825.1 tyrosine-type recombinase/integrase [Bradyrhizobium ottawaense]